MMVDIRSHSRLEFGIPVICADGAYGALEDLLLDATTLRLVHLVVQPTNVPGQARLVPVELAATLGGGGVVELRCSADQVSKLAPVHEVGFIGSEEPFAKDDQWDVGVTEALPMPNYGGGGTVEDTDIMLRYDRVPKGEVELRAASFARTVDGGDAGRVIGFLLDGVRITHLALKRGHLWRRRELVVSAADIASVSTDAIDLKLSEAQLKALPSRPVR